MINISSSVLVTVTAISPQPQQTHCCTACQQILLLAKMKVDRQTPCILCLVMLVRHWPWCTVSEGPRLRKINPPRMERIERICVERLFFAFWAHGHGHGHGIFSLILPFADDTSQPEPRITRGGSPLRTAFGCSKTQPVTRDRKHTIMRFSQWLTL